MSDYITIAGTLLDSIKTNNSFPKTTIKIETLDYNDFNPIPSIVSVDTDNNGNYSFEVLKGCNYKIIITTLPQQGIKRFKNSIEFYLQIPIVVDDTINYNLSEFMVTNFNPVSQNEDVNYVTYLYNNESYQLLVDNNALVFRKEEDVRQFNLTTLFRKGGVLNNNSFEYDLVNEDYTFIPVVTSGSAAVSTTYNTDIPTSDVLTIDEDTRSLDLNITVAGSSEDDVILKQKLLPNSIKAVQQYRLQGYYKLVSGTVSGDIVVTISNTNEDIVTFDNIEIDENNTGWVYFDIFGTSGTETEIYSSSQIYFNFKLGMAGQIRILLDELVLTEYFT